MKEYVIKLGARVDTNANRANIHPVANDGGITQIISAYGSNISIVKVDYEVQQFSGNHIEEVPYPAVYANFGELEDSIPLKNGVAYTPETPFEKVQFNLKIDGSDIVKPRGLHAWTVKATIRILIGDGKYEQFATDAALNALEAISQLQLKTLGGEYLGSQYQQSTYNRLEEFHQVNIQPEDMPAGTNYATLEFQELEHETSAGFIFGEDLQHLFKAIILNATVSQNNGAALLSKVELIKVNRLLNKDLSLSSEELAYNRAKVSFEVDASQHLTILQRAYYKYRWYNIADPNVNRYGFASWKIEFYKR